MKNYWHDYKTKLILFIVNPGHGTTVLSPGIHSFPFKLGLPMGLPSTFLGTHGWVQYFCKAALREPNGLTHKNQQVFIVMNPIDLNLEPPVLSVSTTQYTFKIKQNKTSYIILDLKVCFMTSFALFQKRVV